VHHPAVLTMVPDLMRVGTTTWTERGSRKGYGRRVYVALDELYSL
jgi:hypothetical protein